MRVSRTGGLILAVLALAASANARDSLGRQGLRGRRLLDSAFCPAGCADDHCQQAGTPGGLRCAQCVSNLRVDRVTGSCSCPQGTVLEASEDPQNVKCSDCPKGSWCAGGVYTLTSPPVKTACADGLTTIGLRSPSQRSCVNLPGRSYSIDSAGNASATLCPANTFSAGLKKQRACVPCPTGFTTNNATGATSPTACVVPPGYYLKTPGQAVPCPKGEWKAGTSPDGNCTKCAPGVTTAAEGATSRNECKVVVKGYYASAFEADGSVTAVTICPQTFYCPGSEAQAAGSGMIACPDGAWTKMPGASTVEECLTPPGYFTDNGVTAPCPAGSFRADWKPATESTTCTACGTGVQADKTDRLVQYYADDTTTDLPVTTSSDDCYIQTGQGLYFETLSKTWRAKDCTSDAYGVSNTTYGLTPAPCRSCPEGLTANNSPAFNNSAKYFVANADGTGGFADELACVTKPGFGMTGRKGQRCDAGSYNPGNNYDACTPCPYGKTTAGAGLGITVADCKVNVGYGFTSDNTTSLCPIGTYNDALVQDTTKPCQSCPIGRTTQREGADSLADCQLCSGGFGFADCATLCGGVGENATYGPPGRALGAACVPCSAQGRTVTYSFGWNKQNDVFSPRTVARTGAITPIECLSEYSQHRDGEFWLPLSSNEGVTVTPGVESFAACVDRCTDASCQLVTYDYVKQECHVRVSEAPVYEGMPWIALKVLPAGYVATSPWSLQSAGNPEAKAASTGVYVYYQEAEALAVGIQEPAPGRNAFTSVQDCLTACDNEGVSCVGITVLSTVEPVQIGKTCAFIRADVTPGKFKRTMIRANLNRLSFPTAFLCPSGYQAGNGPINCVPITDAQVAAMILTGFANCTSQTIEGVRTSVFNFLSNPNNVFGVFVPGLQLEIDCFELPVGQTPPGRRLLADSEAIITVRTTFPGNTIPAIKVVQVLENAGCEGIPGLSSIFVSKCTLQRGYVSEEDIKKGGMSLIQTPTPPGERLEFVATYTEDGVAVSRAFPIALTTEPADALDCTNAPRGGAQVFTCYPVLLLESFVVTATGPNPDKPNQRVTASVTAGNLACAQGSVLEPQADIELLSVAVLEIGDLLSEVPEPEFERCVLCAQGTYAAYGDSTCSPCKAGFTTAAPGSVNETQCSVCAPGWTGPDCTLCAPNFGTHRSVEDEDTMDDYESIVDIPPDQDLPSEPPTCPGESLEMCQCRPCPKYFMRPFSAIPGKAKCYFYAPLLVTLEAAADTCSSAITDSISKAFTDVLEAAAAFDPGEGDGEGDDFEEGEGDEFVLIGSTSEVQPTSPVVGAQNVPAAHANRAQAVVAPQTTRGKPTALYNASAAQAAARVVASWKARRRAPKAHNASTAHTARARADIRPQEEEGEQPEPTPGLPYVASGTARAQTDCLEAGNGRLLLFTTIEFGTIDITMDLQVFYYGMGISLAGGESPCASEFPIPGLCSLVTINKAAVGMVDPWLPWTASYTANSLEQGFLELSVGTVQEGADESPYENLALLGSIGTIPFALVPVEIAPSDFLGCPELIPRTMLGLARLELVCDVKSNGAVASFRLVGPAPDRLLPGGGTGPVSEPWALGADFLGDLLG